MASFDALLQLLIAQGAQSLVLAAGVAPELSKNGEIVALSMPPLARETLARFAHEARTAAAAGRYALDAKGAEKIFDVIVDGDDRLEFRLSGASPAVQDPAPASAIGAVERLVGRALELQASDLFVSSAEDARVRVGGRLQELAGTRCTEDAILGALGVTPAAREQLSSRGSLDLAVALAGARVRANVFRHQAGLAAAIRPIRPVRTLAQLGLPGDLAELTAYKDGLVLMVGPAGSGKSSTLAALVDHLNRTRACHVVTIEDPVEFEYEPGRCLINQREIGRQVESFSSGLRACLRQSPDVILLGEMRDPETIAAALTAAETGHVVLSTLHAGSADMAIDRIIDAFAPHQQGQVRTQLASVLRAVVTQLLLPATAAARNAPEAPLVPALEKMVVTHAIAHAIRESRGHQISTHIQTGRADGMISLEMSLAALVKQGRISRDTALSAARNDDVIRKLLGF